MFAGAGYSVPISAPKAHFTLHIVVLCKGLFCFQLLFGSTQRGQWGDWSRWGGGGEMGWAAGGGASCSCCSVSATQQWPCLQQQELVQFLTAPSKNQPGSPLRGLSSEILPEMPPHPKTSPPIRWLPSMSAFGCSPQTSSFRPPSLRIPPSEVLPWRSLLQMSPLRHPSFRCPPSDVPP